jgi:hypothetical protein
MVLHLAKLQPCSQTELERLARDKYSSVLRKFVNYGQKKLYNMEPRV